MEIVDLLVLATIVESTWNIIKNVYKNNKVDFNIVGTILLGILICIATNRDIFLLLGIKSHIPYLGIIVTGVFISRGSNFIHDLIKSLENLKQK